MLPKYVSQHCNKKESLQRLSDGYCRVYHIKNHNLYSVVLYEYRHNNTFKRIRGAAHNTPWWQHSEPYEDSEFLNPDELLLNSFTGSMDVSDEFIYEMDIIDGRGKWDVPALIVRRIDETNKRHFYAKILIACNGFERGHEVAFEDFRIPLFAPNEINLPRDEYRIKNQIISNIYWEKNFNPDDENFFPDEQDRWYINSGKPKIVHCLNNPKIGSLIYRADNGLLIDEDFIIEDK